MNIRYNSYYRKIMVHRIAQRTFFANRRVGGIFNDAGFTRGPAMLMHIYHTLARYEAGQQYPRTENMVFMRFQAANCVF